MRNLVVLNRGSIQTEARTYPDLKPVQAVFDTISDSVTYALVAPESPIIEIQQCMKNGSVFVLASFEPQTEDKILSLSHFVEVSQIVVVFEKGDILTATYDSSAPDPDTTVVEIVGSIDVGILSSVWSPDEEILSLVTAESNLILLLRTFEPILERTLNNDDIKITDSKHVSVGWGKKETQFTGKGMRAKERAKREAAGTGKTAGEIAANPSDIVRDPTVQEVERGTLSEFDSHSVTISWRGDCEYFSVSTVETVIIEDTTELYERRVIRVFSRAGELDSVNEAVDGLEGNLAWKPQGSLIALTQRHSVYDEDMDEEFDALDLVFYERNGLRHGEFNTRLDPISDRVESLHWSADSEILAIQLSDRIQLWTTKNYHWYLKQEIVAPGADSIVFVKFHPEKALQFMYATQSGSIEMINLASKFATGPTYLGQDEGMVIVADGTTVKISPLAIANVPPPIAFRDFDVDGPITDLAVDSTNSTIAVLTSNNDIHLVGIDLKSQSKQPKLKSTIENFFVCGEGSGAQQVALTQKLIAVSIGSIIKLFDIASSELIDEIDVQNKIVLLKTDQEFKTITFQTIDARVLIIDNDTMEVKQVAVFPQLTREFELSYIDGQYTAFGISLNGKLYANEQLISSAVTSIKITELHLLFTTAQAKLCFVHLNGEGTYYEFTVQENETVRDIERGSVLVLAIPSKYSVVLEAQRGNLETIFPRIMVLLGVRQYILAINYREAFLACRTHRIDLDILHDHNPELFFKNIETFVNQIKQVEHIDLFLSCLHEEDVCQTKYQETNAKVTEITSGQALSELKLSQSTKQSATKEVDSKINKICEAVLEVLKKPEYFESYLQTVITAYACMKPANLVGALELISSIKSEDQVEQTVTHLCFLQDVNKLYNVSLGTYNIQLTLLIAQKSQKDPKEYLPFLQNLHDQSELRRKFLIDDHLKKYDKALNWLYQMGSESKDEIDDYVVVHASYKHALQLYKENPDRKNDILALFASYLNETQKYDEAALIYDFLHDWSKAMENYILCKKWNEALLICESHFPDQIEETSTRLIGLLSESHQYKEAAEIELYLGNLLPAVRLYCKNYHFEEAFFLASRQKDIKDELMTEIDSQISEGFGIIAELLADCNGQLQSQLRRLRELRAKKEEDPFSFYGTSTNDDTPDNVSIAASETSTTPSFFTRYTGKTAGTAKTGASRKSSKNRKREERKRAKGRKGTIYEEEYLIKSVGRLVERLDQTEKDGVRLIEALVRRGRNQEAYLIQTTWLSIVEFLKENIVEIHKMSDRDRERVNDDGEVYMIDVIQPPQIKEFPYKKILDY